MQSLKTERTSKNGELKKEKRKLGKLTKKAALLYAANFSSDDKTSKTFANNCQIYLSKNDVMRRKIVESWFNEDIEANSFVLYSNSFGGKSYFLVHYLLPAIIGRFGSVLYFSGTSSRGDIADLKKLDAKIQINKINTTTLNALSSYINNIDEIVRLAAEQGLTRKLKITAIIFNDFLALSEKKRNRLNKIIKKLLTRGRHLHIVAIVLTQSFFLDMAKAVRSNVNHVFFFSMSTEYKDLINKQYFHIRGFQNLKFPKWSVLYKNNIDDKKKLLI